MQIDVRKSRYDKNAWFAAAHDQNGKTLWVGTEGSRKAVWNEARQEFKKAWPFEIVVHSAGLN